MGNCGARLDPPTPSLLLRFLKIYLESGKSINVILEICLYVYSMDGNIIYLQSMCEQTHRLIRQARGEIGYIVRE